MANETQLDRMAGWYGDDIIVGNALYTAPAGRSISSITVRVDGTIIQALKEDISGVSTVVVANKESTFKSPAVVLNNGEWHTFLKKITSIQLTGVTDSVTVWFNSL